MKSGNSKRPVYVCATRCQAPGLLIRSRQTPSVLEVMEHIVYSRLSALRAPG